MFSRFRPMKPIFTSDFYTLYHIPESECMVQQWTGSCSSADFRATHLKSVDFFETSGCRHVVSDIHLAPPLPKDDAAWAAEVILAKYRQANLAVLRIVKPAEAKTQLVVNNLVSTGQAIRVFNTLEEALHDIQTP
jgi:hypothetical protein